MVDATERSALALMQRDRMALSTWRDAIKIFEACLGDGKPEQALPLLEWLRPDAWLAASSCDFYSWAVAVYVHCGKWGDAVALIREALRVGYGRLWNFDGAYASEWRFDAEAGHWVDKNGKNPHANDSHGIYKHHFYLQPLYTNPAVQPAVQEVLARRRAEPRPSYERPRRTAPMCWLESTLLTRKNARCDVSGQPLQKGDTVWAIRHYNGSADIRTEPLVAEPAAFAKDAQAQLNATRYRTDGYALEDFAFGRSHGHPWINAQLFEPSAFDLDRALDFMSAPPTHPTPYYLVSPGGGYESRVERRIGHGSNRELVDFLWILVKSGHLPAILKRLPELPRHFAFLLMLFARDDLRAHVAERLGIPELPAFFAVFDKPRLSAVDIATLARFGRDHAELRQVLAESLRVYEYHLYSNYTCSPNWFFQDFRYFVRARAGHFLYALSAEPELLRPLSDMVSKRALATGGASAADIEYTDMEPFFYGATLLHSAFKGGETLEFWRNLPEQPKHRDLASTRKLVLKAATLV